ncbi:hypothetical protein F751_5394 [Auxenochlorella protothecoides]|uniref:Uncharacterized protein n=1 Tax=Auxenochlorella protothecoides TaxID=3075 RepID=A0A087SQ25_AUXPR|nr:hypothetical protein F751_5394 [Auxenochlorella protothecoides]KFM27829.1 hypothetical protein F751_5394 [Auxenochlorella protothecoides]
MAEPASLQPVPCSRTSPPSRPPSNHDPANNNINPAHPLLCGSDVHGVPKVGKLRLADELRRSRFCGRSLGAHA